MYDEAEIIRMLRLVKSVIIPILGVVILLGIGTILLQDHSCLASTRDLYFELPSSAAGLKQQSIQSSRSCTLWVKFEISPTELENFIVTTFVQTPLSSINMPQSIGGVEYIQQQTGWKLASATSYVAGETKGSGKLYLDQQWLFVDTSDQSKYVIYLTTNHNWL